jgi:hypothetical protein
MPARSKKQQMAAGAALAAKRGERSKASLKGALGAGELAQLMLAHRFHHLARGGLPRKRRA